MSPTMMTLKLKILSHGRQPPNSYCCTLGLQPKYDQTKQFAQKFVSSGKTNKANMKTKKLSKEVRHKVVEKHHSGEG